VGSSFPNGGRGCTGLGSSQPNQADGHDRGPGRAGSPDFGNGPEGVKHTVTLYRNTFPDLQFTIDHMIDADEFVTTRFTSRGTHKGALLGIAPTNKTIKVEGIAINRISRGRIAEGWVVWDALGMMQQLGVVPAFEKAKAQVSK
jgi:predicted ester cyclase